MSTQIQFRRGTTAEIAAATPALGEIGVDTDKKVVVVGDGATAGGFPMAPEFLVAGGIDGRIMGHVAGKPAWTDPIPYLEDVWTPALLFGGANTGIAYSLQFGRFIRIGSLVSAQFRITLSNKGTAVGSASIDGLPYNPVANGGEVHIGFYSNMTLANPGITGFLSNTSGTSFFLRNPGTATLTQLADTAFANNSVIIGSATYFTDEPI